MNELHRIDLDEPLYELCRTHPQLIGILAELGFRDITKPGMLQTAGRLMTIPKGAAMKHIDVNELADKLRQHGYEPVKGGAA